MIFDSGGRNALVEEVPQLGELMIRLLAVRPTLVTQVDWRDDAFTTAKIANSHQEISDVPLLDCLGRNRSLPVRTDS